MTGIENILLAAQQSAQQAAGISGAASQTIAAATGAGGATSTLDTPFSALFQDAVHQTQQLENDAANKVTGLLSGQGVDVHTAMIATEKADLGFEMMLAFRNKAVGAYQQMMQMQF